MTTEPKPTATGLIGTPPSALKQKLASLKPYAGKLAVVGATGIAIYYLARKYLVKKRWRR